MSSPWTSGASASLGGAPVTLVDESAFCISNDAGDLEPDHPHGFVFRDTRFLSALCVRVDERWPEPLTSSSQEPSVASFVLRDHPPAGLADADLLVTRRRYVGRGMREDIELANYGVQEASCVVEVLFDCDFADLFEVKEGRVPPRPDIEVEVGDRTVRFAYGQVGFRRQTELTFAPGAMLSPGVARYEAIVPAGGSWSTCIQVTPWFDDTPVVPRYRCGFAVEHSTPARRLAAWRRKLPEITTDHDGLGTILGRSTEDLAALRIFDPEFPNRAVVAAGAPWFMALFGRDSLLTSWMSLLADPELAVATLETLARFQGTDADPATEEQPGRILHEMRFGETAALALGGGRIYYGTVDATPLFVMLLGELERWGVAPGTVDELLPAADRALAWIEDLGDRDGDGYVEYQRSGSDGLANQGWKDSWDAVRFANGRLGEPPIALCEVQGYVYGALLARAELAVTRDEAALAVELRGKAAELKTAFNRDFWLEEQGWFAMGLDRDKRPIDALASNVGHCLWTGIVDDELAPRVAQALLSPMCFTGWGIRTLAASMTGYNPVGYHVGTVWPHDNAIAVAGLMRYGFVEEAHRVLEGVLAAGQFFDGRLPELFAGLGRDELGFPVSYPTSCSPQAWAAAAPLLMLRAVLGVEPDVPRGTVRVTPALPEWLGALEVARVPLAGGELSFEANGTSLRLRSVPPGIEVRTSR